MTIWEDFADFWETLDLILLFLYLAWRAHFSSFKSDQKQEKDDTKEDAAAAFYLNHTIYLKILKGRLLNESSF